MRYPGTVIVEILDPIPANLPRAEFRDELQARIEAAASRLIVEAARSSEPPPSPADVLRRAEGAATKSNTIN
jgi:1-acyl-sn-glycerol-3-phosphate acyltransferase